MLCWSTGYNCCVSWKRPLSWKTCHFQPALKSFLFYVNRNLLLMFVTVTEKSHGDRHSRWPVKLGLNLDWTWIELQPRENGRKIDGIIYTITLLFKLTHVGNVDWRKFASEFRFLLERAFKFRFWRIDKYWFLIFKILKLSMVFQKLYAVEHALYILLKETAVSQQIDIWSKCAHPVSYFFA